jgi:glycosyltransferase involved in cell wall biosynthesis
MSAKQPPLVSVVTPVYNGEPYIRPCIESVLAQTYRDFEYIILNNCSRDRTLEIATQYGNRDPRIRVHNNEQFLTMHDNHNKAVSLISPASKYCKVVSADDWLYPECVTRMVELAEANPSVGIVGSYQLCGGEEQWCGGEERWYVRNHGVPYDRAVIPGAEISRLQLLDKVSVFGTPTSTMYRADLVRRAVAFYPNSTAEDDTSACFQALQYSDFGFIQQVLSYERLHRNRGSATSQEVNSYLSSAISDCINYGKSCLTEAELAQRVDRLIDEYYVYLARSAFKKMGPDFWQYHQRRLEEIGFPLERGRLLRAMVMKLIMLLLNPVRLTEVVAERVSKRRRGWFERGSMSSAQAR